VGVDSVFVNIADSAEVDSVSQGASQTMSDVKARIKWLTLRKVFLAILFFVAAYFIMKYLNRFLEIVAERYANFRLTIKRIIPIISILGWTLVIYVIIAGIFSPPLETFIAFAASAGVAIGFASQDILKNIFGGVMILIDRPFQVGDKIQVGDHYGEVMQIGLRTVRIVTPDDSMVSIPNGEMMNKFVSNANSGASNCQVVAEFYLPADIDMAQAKKIAYRTAAVSRYCYLNKPIVIIFRNEVHHGRSMLKMRLKAYVLDIRYEFPFYSEMTETVIKEFLRHDLMIIQPSQVAKRSGER
jgi:small-conductance mechanosensitive channel